MVGGTLVTQVSFKKSRLPGLFSICTERDKCQPRGRREKREEEARERGWVGLHIQRARIARQEDEDACENSCFRRWKHTFVVSTHSPPDPDNAVQSASTK